jgi:hypothetical protein
MTTREGVYVSAHLSAEDTHRFAIRACRAEFQSQLPKVQAETLARVKRTVEAHPTSYLAKHWKEIYQ